MHDPGQILRAMGIELGVYVLAKVRNVEHGEAIASRLARKGVDAVVVVMQAPERFEDGLELLRRIKEAENGRDSGDQESCANDG